MCLFPFLYFLISKPKKFKRNYWYYIDGEKLRHRDEHIAEFLGLMRLFVSSTTTGTTSNDRGTTKSVECQ